MKESKEILYHVIDWVLAVIGMIIGYKKENIVVVILIVFIAIGVSIIIVSHKRCEKIENELSAAKQKIDTYEGLLNSSYPLYGIANYISKNTKKQYCNMDIHLERLFLDVKLVNDVVPLRHNDMQIVWELTGVNISEKDIDKLYMRIGGDSSTAYENLNIKAVACLENARYCKQKCNDDIKLDCLKDYEMNVEDIQEYSTKTFHLLEMEFTSPVKPAKMFKTKVKYTWPQCFNPYVDVLLIDPNNYARSIEKLNVRIHTDGKIITRDTAVFMHSIYMETNEYINEGKFMYLEEEKCFVCEIEQTNNKKIYYVKIKNN